VNFKRRGVKLIHFFLFFLFLPFLKKGSEKQRALRAGDRSEGKIKSPDFRGKAGERLAKNRDARPDAPVYV
jgi:hypothetical protein